MAVVDMLAAYDDLIENNRRRMALLEEAARQLYREWFVRLRFPGHEHVRVVDGVPEGWERRTLSDYAVLNYGKALSAGEREDGSIPVYGSSGIVGHHSKALVEGAGIILGRKGNVGSVHWSSKAFWPIDTVFFVSPDRSDLWLYYALQQMHFINTDVAVPGLILNRDFAHSRPLLIPANSLIRDFVAIVDLMHAQIAGLDESTGRLRSARDLLLPKLMSGEIAV